MNFSKPRFLWGEPFFDFYIDVNFKRGIYSFGLIVAHYSIFNIHRVRGWGWGFDILGFGIQSD